MFGTATGILLKPGHSAESISKLPLESWLDCWVPRAVGKQLCFASLQALSDLNVARFTWDSSWSLVMVPGWHRSDVALAWFFRITPSSPI